VPFRRVTSDGEIKESEWITDAHFIAEGGNYPFVKSNIHDTHLGRHFKERIALPVYEDEIDIMGVFHQELRGTAAGLPLFRPNADLVSCSFSRSLSFYPRGC
jgi:hypothetical protein